MFLLLSAFQMQDFLHLLQGVLQLLSLVLHLLTLQSFHLWVLGQFVLSTKQGILFSDDKQQLFGDGQNDLCGGFAEQKNLLYDVVVV